MSVQEMAVPVSIFPEIGRNPRSNCIDVHLYTACAEEFRLLTCTNDSEKVRDAQISQMVLFL